MGKNGLYCPRCGCRWHQKGNQSGHCSQCHRTFSSEFAFDKHQTINDGIVTCRDPEALGLVSRVDKYGTAQWGRPAPTAFQNGRSQA